MSEASTFLLENDSKQQRRKGEPFSVLHPKRLLHYAEIVNAARRGINSHLILPIARECAAREPEGWD